MLVVTGPPPASGPVGGRWSYDVVLVVKGPPPASGPDGGRWSYGVVLVVSRADLWSWGTMELCSCRTYIVGGPPPASGPVQLGDMEESSGRTATSDL